MKKIKKLFSIFLVGILSLGVFALVGCKKTDETVEDLSAGTLTVTPNASNAIEIVTLNSEVVTTDVGAYITKTLEATILNSDGTTSSDCSWTVYWGDNALDEDVTNYIQVNPQTIKTKAFINCYKPFSGSTIIVEVTATETGDKATCVCEYIGVADRVYAELNGVNYGTSTDLTLNSGTYTFNLNLANVFGAVDSSNANFKIKQVYGNGQFIATSSSYVGDGVTETSDVTLQMSNIYSDFVSATISGNVLTVNVLQVVNSYYKYANSERTYFKDFHYDPRGGGRPTECSVIVYLTESVTGKEILLNIRPLDTAKLDSSSITF